MRWRSSSEASRAWSGAKRTPEPTDTWAPGKSSGYRTPRTVRAIASTAKSTTRRCASSTDALRALWGAGAAPAHPNVNAAGERQRAEGREVTERNLGFSLFVIKAHPQDGCVRTHRPRTPPSGECYDSEPDHYPFHGRACA